MSGNNIIGNVNDTHKKTHKTNNAIFISIEQARRLNLKRNISFSK